MKFGVFVRSIGERTEQLCIDSVKLHVPKKNIHLIKNYYPSYKAFLKMFEIAKVEKYDWFLGLDADVILKSGWIEVFKKYVPIAIDQKLFRFYFYVDDFLSQSKQIRGNNWYNGRYSEECIRFLKLNIRIGRHWWYYKYLYKKKGYFLKPESSIRTHMKKKKDILDVTYDETIGWHGYEQYYSEIFRQMVTRRKREKGFKRKNNLDFLDIQQQYLLKGSKDSYKYVANIGWNLAEEFRMKDISGLISSPIQLKLEDLEINELEPLKLSLDNFYEKYLL